MFCIVFFCCMLLCSVSDRYSLYPVLDAAYHLNGQRSYDILAKKLVIVSKGFQSLFTNMRRPEFTTLVSRIQHLNLLSHGGVLNHKIREHFIRNIINKNQYYVKKNHLNLSYKITQLSKRQHLFAASLQSFFF